MIKNLKLLFISIALFFLTIQIALPESLEDLAKELNDIREEIANLTQASVNNPILPVVGKSGKPLTGMIIKSSENSKVITFIPLGQPGAKPQTGVLLGDSDVKDIAVIYAAEQAAKLAAEQVGAQSSIDKALKELDEATKFMQESYAKGDVDGAIAALAVLDVAISDVSRNVPYEFVSEVIKEGRDFTTEEMKKISLITKNISNKKVEDYKELKEQIETATEKGLDVVEITNKIISSGIKTPKLNDYYKQASNLELRKNLSDSIKYSNIIGKSSDEVDIAVRQAVALKSGDPKKLRAIEIEKYGKAAGLSKEMINKGIDAVYNGDIKFEKEISKNIIQKLRSNPNYEVASISDADIDALVNEQIATEKAAYKILNSGIDFARGTNDAQVKKLADDIEKILDGKVDKNKIQQIKYNISRSSVTITSKENVAANLIAEIRGQQYVDALHQASIGSKSMAEQAAVVEASLSGNMEAFRQVTRSTNKDSLSVMSADEVNQLTKVYSDVIKSENLSNQIKQDVKVIIGKKAVAETTVALKEASRASQIAQENLKQKRAEIATQQEEYKEILAEQKAGRATLSQVLAKNRERSEIFRELSEVQSIANTASRAAGAAAEAAGSARAAAKIAAETASGAVSEVAEAAQEATSEVTESASEAASEVAQAAESVAEVAQEAAQEAVQEVAQEVAEVAQEAAQEIAQEVAQTLDEQIADLQEARDLAWDAYYDESVKSGYNAEVHHKYLDASSELADKKSEKRKIERGN